MIFWREMRTMSSVSITVALLAMLIVVCGKSVQRPSGGAHAPCYNCEFYNLMQNDEAFFQRQIQSQCHYPCKCTTDYRLRCKEGVPTIKDGCSCCFMCARQQGDMCDKMMLCDNQKDLYCDYKLNGGLKGICRAKRPKNCKVNGTFYADGEQFKASCKELCTCQNGMYGCVSLCSQETRKPSSQNCPNPVLVTIPGKCCKEWVCPVLMDQPAVETATREPKPLPKGKRCNKETTAWSACSQSCGMGVSIRVTNDNENCQPVQQRRLCLIRPCGLDDSRLKGRKCKQTARPIVDLKLRHKSCTSVKQFRPKYCTTCKRNRCCVPELTKTITVEFRCPNNTHRIENFMWIKKCKCHKSCPWYKHRGR